MKKILGISLVAVLMAMPMMANAAPVAGDPGATTSGAGTAGSAPKYALKNAGDDDGKVATAAYVKGAYNAVIKGINKTQDEINTLNTDITTYRNAIGQLTTGKATQSGTVATIKDATTNESIATSSVNISGVTTTSISATASGNVNLSVPAMDDWENDSEASDPIQTTTTFTGLTVNGLSMSAPGALSSSTITQIGINGTVNVAAYTAPFDFTTLIGVDGDEHGYKNADGTDIRNDTGLSNGEWKAIWNDYGTVKGTSMCSADWDGYSVGNTISGTPAAITDENAQAGCWCKMTGWTPNGDNETPVSSLWVFRYTYGSAAGCARYCAIHCGGGVSSGSVMRSGMFNNVQQ